jgi:hypothetical protein
MISKLDDRVRRRAHSLWEQAGRPLGRNAEFWDRAHREVTEAFATAAAPRTDVASVREPQPVSEDAS